MDEILTYRADSRFPGDGLIRPAFQSSRDPRQNDAFPRGIHTHQPVSSAHPAAPRSPHQPTNPPTHQRTNAYEYEEKRTVGRTSARCAVIPFAVERHSARKGGMRTPAQRSGGIWQGGPGFAVPVSQRPASASTVIRSCADMRRGLTPLPENESFHRERCTCRRLPCRP